jgi:hypothetical protein
VEIALPQTGFPDIRPAFHKVTVFLYGDAFARGALATITMLERRGRVAEHVFVLEGGNILVGSGILIRSFRFSNNQFGTWITRDSWNTESTLGSGG